MLPAAVMCEPTRETVGMSRREVWMMGNLSFLGPRELSEIRDALATLYSHQYNITHSWWKSAHGASVNSSSSTLNTCTRSSSLRTSDTKVGMGRSRANEPWFECMHGEGYGP